MPGFFLSLMAVLALALPGRDGLRVAQIAARLGAGPGLLAAIWLSAVATCALAAWASTLLAPLMPGPAKLMLVAFALLAGAAELAFRRAPRAPAEPTRSVGAIALVLLASQATDGARFLLLAVALVTAEPVAAAAGGALASGAVLTLAAMAGPAWSRLPLRATGWAIAAVLLLFAIATALAARGAF